MLTDSSGVKRAWRKTRRRAGVVGIEVMLNAVCRIGKLHPMAWEAARKVAVTKNVPYTGSGLPAHRMDIYRPRERSGPLPTVLYVHGGGFRILSKESHWMMALAFASRGYLVFNVEYRRGAYPRGLEDVCQAARWLMREGARYGADLDRLAFAGDSAGANLVTALAVALASTRAEPWAQAAAASGLAPKVVMPACGFLEVSDPARLLARNPSLKSWVADRILGVSRGYVGAGAPMNSLADPLRVLESDVAFDRPLPRFLIACGTRDPLLDDSRRLAAALARREVPAELKVYPGGVHAFHALVWRDLARACWRDHFAFLEDHL